MLSSRSFPVASLSTLVKYFIQVSHGLNDTGKLVINKTGLYVLAPDPAFVISKFTKSLDGLKLSNILKYGSPTNDCSPAGGEKIIEF